MKYMDALMKWWADPETIVIPAGQDNRVIDWLDQQNADTWHQVVMSWNYDHGSKVLSWMLQQDRCDQGTAAQVFLVEGDGHWLWDALADPNKPQDDSHVCSVILKNWDRYKTADLQPKHRGISDRLIALVEEKGNQGRYANTALQDIMRYTGKRQAASRFGSEDGQIVVALEHWAHAKGIEITA
ncbi:DUF4274 domain-containing protein [Aliisedimentitalea scapharcae]|uniref:DUF4274 domain-containing protein n=1 Tax=Aliisedimentitalea scapharcae TaxID=1524259 RepID=A0ABZ2XTS9_9RHOB